MINIQFFMFVPVEYYDYNPTQKWQMYTALWNAIYDKKIIYANMKKNTNIRIRN